MLRSLYAIWRYRGVDPYVYLYGEVGSGDPESPVPGPWEDGHEAVLVAFAEYAAEVDGAMLTFGMALAGGMG